VKKIFKVVAHPEIMEERITIWLHGEKKPLTAQFAFVDGEARMVEINLENGYTRKIPFESIKYFDVKKE